MTAAPAPIALHGAPIRVDGRVWVLLAVALVGAALGCPKSNPGPDSAAELPALTSPDAEAEAALREADARLADGDPVGAESRYRAFLRDFVADPLAPLARLALGRILLERGAVAEAMDHLRPITTHSDPGVRERARLLEGVGMARTGAWPAAVARLRPLRGRTVDPADTVLLLEALGGAEAQMGDLPAAVRTYDELAQHGPDEASRARGLASASALLERASTGDIQAVADAVSPDGPLWPQATKAALRQAFASSSMARVRELAARLREHNVRVDDELTAMALRAEQDDSVDARAIGVILPLSGRAQSVGEDVLRGVMFATGAGRAGPAMANAWRVAFRDDGDDPARARAAVDDLVTTHRVAAIVGPLGPRPAEAVEARAESLGVPVIALSPRRASASQSVSSLMMSPEEELRALLSAAAKRGARTVTVLGADAPYGRAISAAARQVAAAAGITLHAAHTYPAGTTNFTDVAKSAAASGSDAYLLADGAASVQLLAPALAAAGLWPKGTPRVPERARAVEVLLPSGAWDAAVLRPSLRYLQGAVVSSPFGGGVEGSAARAFSEAYAAEYGRAPSFYAALGYDAARLIMHASEPVPTGRAALAQAIRRARIEPAGPSEGLTASGTPLRPTRLWAVAQDGLGAPLE